MFFWKNWDRALQSLVQRTKQVRCWRLFLVFVFTKKFLKSFWSGWLRLLELVFLFSGKSLSLSRMLLYGDKVTVLLKHCTLSQRRHEREYSNPEQRRRKTHFEIKTVTLSSRLWWYSPKSIHGFSEERGGERERDDDRSNLTKGEGNKISSWAPGLNAPSDIAVARNLGAALPQPPCYATGCAILKTNEPFRECDWRTVLWYPM